MWHVGLIRTNDRVLNEKTERDQFLVRAYSYFEDLLWNHLEPIYSDVVKGVIGNLRRRRRR